MPVGKYRPAWDETLNIAASIPDRQCMFRYVDGTESKLNLTFRDLYKDEYTGEELPQAQIREAIHEELSYFVSMSGAE